MEFKRHKKIIPLDIVTQLREDLSFCNFQEAKVNDELKLDVRQNYDCKLDLKFILLLENYILPLLPKIYMNRKLIGLDSDSAYALAYHPGNFFKMHTDGSSYNRRGEKSLLTVQVYLSDAVTEENFLNPEFQSIGGETIFEGYPTQLHDIGDIVVFDHNIPHGGSEVISGLKVALRLNVIYSNILTYEKNSEHLSHLKIQPAVTFEKRVVPHSHFKFPMDFMHDICTSCFGYTRIDEKHCQHCNCKITIIPEVYEKRLQGWFMPK